MTRPSQKEEEQFDVKEFLKAIKSNAQVQPAPDDNEPPDCFLRLDDGKCISLEHTRYNSCERLKAGEEAWKQIRELFHKQRKGDLLRSFGWLCVKDKLKFPSKHKFQKVVDELSKFCLSVCARLTANSQEFKPPSKEFPLLGQYLKSVDLCIMSQAHNQLFDTNYNVGMIELNEDCLLKTLNKKGRVSRSKDITEYWLVIVSALDISQSTGPLRIGQLNGFARVNEKLLSMPYSSVYIFSEFHDKVVPCWKQSSKRWEQVDPPQSSEGGQ